VRLLLLLVTVVLSQLAITSAASAEPAVEQIPDSCRREPVFAAGQLVYCGAGKKQRLASRMRWSNDGTSVAFALRGAAGDTRHVVAIVSGDAAGTLLSWAVRMPTSRRWLSVTWLDGQRVALGRSPIRPDAVASWRLKVM
jgi:hypothetical protein